MDMKTAARAPSQAVGQVGRELSPIPSFIGTFSSWYSLLLHECLPCIVLASSVCDCIARVVHGCWEIGDATITQRKKASDILAPK